MNFSLPELEANLERINKLVKNELYEEAYREYQITDKDIEMNRYVITEIANFYASYAYFLFSFSEYSQFFEMYIKAQEYGYSSEKRREFIYEAFIEPNLKDFRLNYIKNIENLKAEGCIEETIDFEELPYWLITSGNENEYYLYEKETDLIKGKFILDIDASNPEISTSSSYYLIINNGNWAEIQSQIKVIRSRAKKSYVIVNDFKKLLSYFQGGIISEKYLSGLIIFEDVNNFERYFINSSNYLPHLFIGTDEERVKYAKIIEKIHTDRLNKEKRHGDNVLLSICIPSYNRGKRAYDNVMHTLQSRYDEEIEIVLSNNGTQNETKEFYDKISRMEDARVTYFEFDENQGFTLNLCKVAELAKGKYILLLSDEDLINLTELESIVNILNSKYDDISIIRTKGNKNGVIPYIGTTDPGKNSLFTFMLSSNYMSGIIYNKQLLEKHHLIEYIKHNFENKACRYYPHMVWELILCQYGNVQGVDIVLVNEGQAEKMDAISGTKIGSTKETFIPYYAKLEGRLDQHEGFLHVIKDLEISKDFDIFRKLYHKLCGKTIFLVSLSIRVYYKQTDTNTDELLENAYNYSIKYLKEIYKDKEKSYKAKFLEDKAVIKQYYEYFKNQCESVYSTV